jgi:hypothetical protein
MRSTPERIRADREAAKAKLTDIQDKIQCSKCKTWVPVDSAEEMETNLLRCTDCQIIPPDEARRLLDKWLGKLATSQRREAAKARANLARLVHKDGPFAEALRILIESRAKAERVFLDTLMEPSYFERLEEKK